MAPAPDPYRTLGLTRAASLAEVKRAYRKLAKENHPDAAGPAALPRFLAIQAAYEHLLTGRAPDVTPAPPRPSSADSDRADATRRAYGGRARRSRPPGGASTKQTGSTGRARSSGSSGSSGPAGSTGAGGTSASADESGSTGADKPKARGKATLGSTSYDGADAGPFEPDWSGATWYGTTSGTYWTINPKEYADPRKHGPEYQARARRAAQARAGAATPGEGSAPERPDAADPADAADGPSEAAARDEPVHAPSGWWEDPLAASGPTNEVPPQPGLPPRPATRARPVSPASGPPAPPDLGAAATELGRALTDERSARGWWRVAQAAIGWLPIAFGVSWLIDEQTGCGRSAASCDGVDTLLGPIVSLAILGVLLLIPRLAAIAAAGAIAVAIAAVPAAFILSASNGSERPPDRTVAFGIVLLLAWIVGLVIGVVRRVRVQDPPSESGRPVS